MPYILVVENDLKFRAPLVKTLTNDGHTVSVAGDGAAALSLLKTRRPDLIITDILMPNMDGIELIIELSRPVAAAVPIIAMSGGRRSLTAEFNLASSAVMGVRVTLAKPFSRADLRRAIEDSLASALPGRDSC